MLVVQQRTKGAVSLPQALINGLSPRFDAHRQGVDKHSQCPLSPFSALHTAEQNGAKYHVVPPGGFA